MRIICKVWETEEIGMSMPSKSSSDKKRFCRLCDIIADIPEDISEHADRLYSLMGDMERADEVLLKERLSVCDPCQKRVKDTCLACGCYTLLRAMAKDNRCPEKRW